MALINTSSTSSYLIDYLLVAGGGAGSGSEGTSAGDASGGGGAGGMLEGSCALVTGMQYVITVGAGGASAGTPSGTGGRGGDSSIGTLAVAIGGGGGVREDWQNTPFPNSYGGSGGGAGGHCLQMPGPTGIENPPGYPFSDQGYRGGYAGQTTSCGARSGAGGGGAGGVGLTAAAGPSDGGPPRSTTFTPNGINPGASLPTYGGGGGGGAGGDNGGRGMGGGAGAGNGGYAANNSNAIGGSASANTGSGGGAAGASTTHSGYAGNGGSGIVIIRYLGSQRFTGGTITTFGPWTYHTFTSTTTITA